MAQTSLPATIVDAATGQTMFRQNALETSPSSSFVPTADFGATPAGACDDDVLFTHACFWRLATDTRLSQFYDSGAVGDQGGITQAANLDQWTIRWPDAANRGVLDATWRAAVTHIADGSGIAAHTWTLANPSDQAIDLEFYVYADIDYVASFGNATAGGSTSERHLVGLHPSLASFCEGFVEFRGVASTSWEVAARPTTEINLLGSTFQPLSNAGLPFGGATGADYAGAFGYEMTIAAGQSVDVAYSFGHHVVTCATPASTSGYGIGYGAVTLASPAAPIVGRGLDLAGSGPNGATCALFLGFQTSATLPGCPQTILVNPFAVVNSAFDMAGNVTFELPPAVGPVFCGFSLFTQLFALSPSEPCLPVLHSAGVELRFGN